MNHEFEFHQFMERRFHRRTARAARRHRIGHQAFDPFLTLGRIGECAPAETLAHYGALHLDEIFFRDFRQAHPGRFHIQEFLILV
ncbi:hypothetical protein SDC9_162689 [bioreactor metagenome]|uniref:Uncharacterized protein n=1 Tax=bioreactor metagenome TaxID=1076179 RepID=A0A645FLS2_9ZZZZ